MKQPKHYHDIPWPRLSSHHISEVKYLGSLSKNYQTAMASMLEGGVSIVPQIWSFGMYIKPFKLVGDMVSSDSQIKLLSGFLPLASLFWLPCQMWSPSSSSPTSHGTASRHCPFLHFVQRSALDKWAIEWNPLAVLISFWGWILEESLVKGRKKRARPQNHCPFTCSIYDLYPPQVCI